MPPTSTTSRDLRDDGGRGGGHDRPEVAGGLAVDEVAHPVGPVGADQRDVALDRVLEDVGAAVDHPGLLALGQRRADAGGQKNAPIPAPAARIRSARLPCGTTSSSILPGR